MKSFTKSLNSNRGYSLIEIMVAMVGLSLVALLLGSVLITTIKSDAAARERDYALMAAKAKMNELTMPNAQININFVAGTPGFTAGTVTPPGPSVIDLEDETFRAPNGVTYVRHWRITDGNPMSVRVSAFLRSNMTDTLASITGFINRDDVCNIGVTILSDRPLNPRINDAATTPVPTSVTLSVVRQFASATDQQISANDIGRLFTAHLQTADVATRADEVAIISATHTRTVPTTVTTQNALIVRNKNELFVNPATVPHLRANDVITAQIRLVDCAERPTTFTAATQVTTVTLTFVAGNSFTVTFNANGGTFPAPGDPNIRTQSVIEGGFASPPVAPTRGTTHEFVAWVTPQTGTTPFAFTTTPITANNTINATNTLWARWESITNHNVTFRLDGTDVKIIPVRGGTAIPSGEIPTFALPHGIRTTNCYDIFDNSNWRLSTAPNTNFNLATVINAPITLDAHWPPRQHQVTFNLNGGTFSGSTNSVTRNVDCGTPISNAPSPTNGTRPFQNWWTAATGGTEFDMSTLINANNTINSTNTLWARWGPEPVTRCEQYRKTVPSTGNVTFSACSYSEMRNGQEEGSPCSNIGQMSNNSELEYCLNVVTAGAHIIRMEVANASTSSRRITLRNGTNTAEIGRIDVPTGSGWIWRQNVSNVTLPVSNMTLRLTVNGAVNIRNIEITRVTQFNIRWHCEGGTGCPNNSDNETSVPIPANNPTRTDGRTFVRWSETQNGTIPVDFPITGRTGTVNIYAVWSDPVPCRFTSDITANPTFPVTRNRGQTIQLSVSSEGGAVPAWSLSTGGTNPTWSTEPITGISINQNTGLITIGSGAAAGEHTISARVTACNNQDRRLDNVKVTVNVPTTCWYDWIPQEPNSTRNLSNDAAAGNGSLQRRGTNNIWLYHTGAWQLLISNAACNLNCGNLSGVVTSGGGRGAGTLFRTTDNKLWVAGQWADNPPPNNSTLQPGGSTGLHGVSTPWVLLGTCP